ncbi:MAG TPA: glycosyl transferase [Bacteroidales bacterium]|nr:glycosyl transferase [Bacteroidales bacterium]
MNKPLFSIITVCFNAQEVIEKTIQSLVTQTNKDYEYIIVDGASKDKTLDIINQYKKHIDVLISEPDTGIYDAMNKGAKVAKGKYVYYLNAGDWFYKDDVLLRVSKKLLKDSEIDVLVGTINLNYPNYEVIKNTQFSKKNIILGKMPPHQASFFSLSALKQLGLFNHKYKSSADFDLMAKAIKHNLNYVNLDVVVANFISGGTSSNKEISYIETYDILKNHFGLLVASFFKIKKIYFEQGLKRLLFALKMNGIYDYLARKNNTRKFIAH